MICASYREKICKDYTAGYSNTQIASRNHVSPTSVRNILIKEGLYKPRRNRKGKKIQPSPIEEEDDLWYKAINLIMAAYYKGLSKDDAVGVVQPLFTISNRK